MLVEVVGTFIAADGACERGLVILRPMARATNVTAASMVYTMAPVSRELSAEGRFMASVAASDDPGWKLDGPLPYKVTERLLGSRSAYYVYIYGPGPVDLADLEHHQALDLVLPGPSPTVLGTNIRRRR
jgi:hypothetical protein